MDLGITINIEGRVSDLARLATFLGELDAAGVDFSLTLRSGDWQETYSSSKAWHDAVDSPFLKSAGRTSDSAGEPRSARSSG